MTTHRLTNFSKIFATGTKSNIGLRTDLHTMLGSGFARLFLTHEKRKYEVARSCTTKHQISSDLLDAVILQVTKLQRRTGSKGVYIYKKMVDNRVFFYSHDGSLHFLQGL